MTASASSTMAETGVLSSCETLATKSRRTASTRCAADSSDAEISSRSSSIDSTTACTAAGASWPGPVGHALAERQVDVDRFAGDLGAAHRGDEPVVEHAGPHDAEGAGRLVGQQNVAGGVDNGIAMR